MMELYDVVYLKDSDNKLVVDPILMKSNVDYKTAIQIKSELDQLYPPNKIVIWSLIN